mmetsp:Transcript_13958/g.34394  ORF Transcript_13958/g.34394 Transcript_13958/m.34394 type:complete len:318 (-) Transcript_13958:3234-4187(-)
MAANSLAVLLTGGTSGIGFQLCKQLLQQGHRVIVACRTDTRAQDAHKQLSAAGLTPDQQKQLQTVVCDLNNFASVRGAAKQVHGLTQQLDALVLNAGMVQHTLARSVDGFECTLQANHLSHFLLTHELLPLLRASARPRVVVVSSELHAKTGALAQAQLPQALFAMACPPGFAQAHALGSPPAYKGMEVYGASKLCNVWFARELAARAPGWLWVASVSPGFVPSTGLHRGSSWLAGLFMRHVMTWAPFAVTVPEGARRVGLAVLGAEQGGAAWGATPSGSYWARGQPQAGSAQSQDTAAARTLWDLSMKATGLTSFL